MTNKNSITPLRFSIPLYSKDVYENSCYSYHYLFYYKVGMSSSKKGSIICFNDCASKMTKKYFLFYLKTSFRSQDS